MAAYSAFAEALLSLPAGATTGEAACVFAASGVPVFPVADGGKQPLTRHWFHDATTDLDRVRAWWSAAPAANIGMPTGAVSGMVVVDVDVHGPANGYVSLDRADRAGLLDGWELLIHTPSDGLHAYYPASPGVVQRSWQAARAGIDFRGDGGYIIVPPLRPSRPGRTRTPRRLLGPGPGHRVPLGTHLHAPSPGAHPPRLRHRARPMVGHPRHP